MRIKAKGSPGVTVAFHNNGQVYGGEVLAWPDDKPVPGWAEVVEEPRPAPAKDKAQALVEPPPLPEPDGEEPEPEEDEEPPLLSSLGDLDDDQLRALIEGRSETKPKGLHLMGRPKLLKLAAEVAGQPRTAEGA